MNDSLEGPSAGLEALTGIDLDGYQPYHAARADLLARAGRTDEAFAAYTRAIEVTSNPAEREFLERQRGNIADSELWPPPPLLITTHATGWRRNAVRPSRTCSPQPAD